MSRQIIWEKWTEDSSEETTINTNTNEDNEIDDGNFKFSFIPVQNLIRTPLGIFSCNDPMLPSKMFDCWIGHTNFDISIPEKKILCTTPGVEVLRILSRYRFFIGIGKLFNFRDVNKELNKRLCGKISIKDVENNAIIDVMSNIKAKKWAVFINENGSIEHVISNKDEDPDYEKKVLEFQNRKNGRVITHLHKVYKEKGMEFL